MKTKIFTLLLAIVASIGTIWAETYSGTCGDNLTWSLNTEDSTLVILGSGATDTYNDSRRAPWFKYREYVVHVSLPIGLDSIKGGFRYCSNIRPFILLPSSVTFVRTASFWDCYGVTVIAPKSMTTDEDGRPFMNTRKVIYYDEIYNDFAFDHTDNQWTLCAYTTLNHKIQLPDNIHGETYTLGIEALENHEETDSIIISSGVTNIKERAFANCTSLKYLEIPGSIQECASKISEIKSTNLAQIQSPAEFFDVEETDWPYCPKHLQEIVINKGELSDNATEVIKRSNKTLHKLDVADASNTVLADKSFKDCYVLDTFALPTNLVHLGYEAVAECVKLKSIDIPASVVEIDDRAFEDCRSLQTITFGGKQPAAISGKSFAPAATTCNLKRIGNWAFYNAHELQHLEIPEGVMEIGDAAFYGCTYLEDLSLPASVQTIGDNTFSLCTRMKKMVVDAFTPPTIQAKTFFEVNRQTPVYVPDESVDAYKADAYWKEFNIQGRSSMPQGIEDIHVDSDKAIKVLNDGQIYILRGDKTYTIQGQEVK